MEFVHIGCMDDCLRAILVVRPVRHLFPFSLLLVFSLSFESLVVTICITDMLMPAFAMVTLARKTVEVRVAVA